MIYLEKSPDYPHIAFYVIKPHAVSSSYAMIFQQFVRGILFHEMFENVKCDSDIGEF